MGNYRALQVTPAAITAFHGPDFRPHHTNTHPRAVGLMPLVQSMPAERSLQGSPARKSKARKGQRPEKHERSWLWIPDIITRPHKHHDSKCFLRLSAQLIHARTTFTRSEYDAHCNEYNIKAPHNLMLPTSTLELPVVLRHWLSAMSGTTDTVFIQETIRDLIAQNYIAYAILVVLIYDIGDLP